MEELICKDCKHYFNGECQNYYLTRAGKKKRMKESECEYWVKRDFITDKTLTLKQKLSSLAFALAEIANSLKDEEK